MDENKVNATCEKEEEKVSGGAVNSPSADLNVSACPLCGGTMISHYDRLTGKVNFRCRNCGFTNT